MNFLNSNRIARQLIFVFDRASRFDSVKLNEIAYITFPCIGVYANPRAQSSNLVSMSTCRDINSYSQSIPLTGEMRILASLDEISTLASRGGSLNVIAINTEI